MCRAYLLDVSVELVEEAYVLVSAIVALESSRKTKFSDSMVVRGVAVDGVRRSQ